MLCELFTSRVVPQTQEINHNGNVGMAIGMDVVGTGSVGEVDQSDR